jgi:hypothetical protein
MHFGPRRVPYQDRLNWLQCRIGLQKSQQT